MWAFLQRWADAQLRVKLTETETELAESRAEVDTLEQGGRRGSRAR